MPYFVVDQFPGGLDVRKPEMSAQPGTSSLAENVHLTSGNDYEIRKAFVSKYSLPPGQTVGLATVNRALYTFGHGAAPTMPAGVNYQQLEHPGGAALTRVLSWDVFEGKLYVDALFSDGSIYHFYDGARVTAWADGRARATFSVTGGSAGGGNEISAVEINGVQLLGVAVPWGTSHVATAAAIASEINSNVSSPDYTAVSIGAAVWVIASSSVADTLNGTTVNVTTGGDVVVSDPTTLNGGTSAAGTYTPGPYVKTHKSKMYSVAGSLLHFSAVNQPTELNPEQPGAGFVNVSNHASGSEELTGLGAYLANLAIFARGAIQIWQVEADDTNNVLVQAITTHGTRAPRTIHPYNETDIGFLDKRGIRALRPSGTVANYANVADWGAPIDKLVRAQVASLADDVVEAGVSTVEPAEGRWFTAIGDTIYVYTYFPDSKVAGWTTYKPGFSVSDFVAIEDRLYARAGNTVYLYGGDDGETYDSTVPRIRLPAIAARAPATFKDLIGFDMGIVGEWKVEIFENPEADTGETVTIQNVMTYDQPSCPINGSYTHPVLEFTGRGSGYRRLVNVVLHFRTHEEE